MKLFTLLLTGLIPFLQSADVQSDQPYSYKNYVLGVTTYQAWSAMLSPKLAKALSKARACSQGTTGVRTCPLTMAGSDSSVGNLTFVDDHLAVLDAIVVMGAGVEIKGYLDLLTERYGDPSISTETFQNGFGATRTGRIWTWKNNVSSADFEEFAPGSFDSPIGPFSRLRYRDLKLADEALKRFTKKPDL